MLKHTLAVLIVFLAVTILGTSACAGLFNKKDKQERHSFRTPLQEIEEDKGYGPGDYERKIRVDGKQRYYELHVPSSYSRSKALPVVLVFHGGGGDPGTIRYESEMDRTADREGFIVVYPAGTNKRLLLKNRMLLWNDGRPFKDGTRSEVDDVGYVAAVLKDLSRLFTIDARRVYACGYSNGGQFTYRLAKRMGDAFGAIAVVAGQRPAKDSFDPPPARPISVMQFSGLEDKLAPYHGGSGPAAAEVAAVSPAVEETIRSWVAFNKCPAEPADTKRVGKAAMKRYGPCQGDTEVVLWTLEDGGHTWPGGRVVPNVELLGLGKMGGINQDVSASELMWEFFKRHPLK